METVRSKVLFPTSTGRVTPKITSHVALMRRQGGADEGKYPLQNVIINAASVKRKVAPSISTACLVT